MITTFSTSRNVLSIITINCYELRDMASGMQFSGLQLQEDWITRALHGGKKEI